MVFDKNIRYVVFFTKGNAQLGEFLTKRAEQLGYTNLSARPDVSVTLCNDGKIRWTSPGSMVDLSDHVYGNFEKFLTTDEYSYEDPIMISGHKVLFNQDGSLTIGCTTVDKKTVDRIIDKVRNANF